MQLTSGCSLSEVVPPGEFLQESTASEQTNKNKLYIRDGKKLDIDTHQTILLLGQQQAKYDKY